VSEVNIAALLARAKLARQKAHAPYSRFYVGAALLGKSGAVYEGCNIENSAYPAGLCAEHAAIAVGVSSGEREFVALAIAGPKDIPIAPCGKCRQVLTEFNPLLPIYLACPNGGVKTFSLDALLPERFDSAALDDGKEAP
jgi:cytidine deaminase